MSVKRFELFRKQLRNYFVACIGMEMQSEFPPIYVINLARDSDRLESFSARLRSLDLAFERIEAVNGAELTPDYISEHSTPACSAFCTRTQIGCYLSHVKVWRRIIDDPESPDVSIIMEDDNIPSDGFVSDVQDVLSSGLRFDILYLGCFGMCGERDPLYALVNLSTSALHVKRIDSPHESLNERLEVPKFPIGAHCYMISKNCIRFLLAKCNLANFHVDVDMAMILAKSPMRVFAFKVPIAYQLATNLQSTQSLSRFPRLLNFIFDKCMLRSKITVGFVLGSPQFQLGPLKVTLYTCLLLALAALLPQNLLRIAAVYFAIELCMEPSNIEAILVFAIAVFRLGLPSTFSY